MVGESHAHASPRPRPVSHSRLRAAAEGPSRHGVPDGSTQTLNPQAALFDLAKLALTGAPLTDLAREAAGTVASVLNADFAHVMKFLPEEGALHLASSVGFQEDLDPSFRVSVGPAARLGYVSQASFTMISGDPVVVQDFDEEPRLEGCDLLKSHGVKSGLTVCVCPEEGQPYGIVGAHWREPREISREETGWLEDLAGVLADAEGRRRSPASTESAALAAQRAERLVAEAGRRYESLRGAMSLVAAAGGPLKALEAAASTLINRGADWAFVDLLEDDGTPGYTTGDKIRRVVVRRAAGAEPDAAARPTAHASGQTAAQADVGDLAGQLATHYPLNPDGPVGTPAVLRQRRPHLCPRLTLEHLAATANNAHHARLIESVEPTSCAAAPIWISGRVAGAVVALSTHGRVLDDDFLTSVEELAECATLALSNSLSGLSFAEERVKIAGLVESGPTVASAVKEEAADSPGSPAGTNLQGPMPPRVITPTQQVILELCAKRLSHKEISKELSITVNSVKQHIRGASVRLGVTGGWRPAFAEALRLGDVGYSKD